MSGCSSPAQITGLTSSTPCSKDIDASDLSFERSPTVVHAADIGAAGVTNAGVGDSCSADVA